MNAEETADGETDARTPDGGRPRRYCMECGCEIEPDADFCFQCGSKRIFEVGADNRVNIDKGTCPYCGSENPPDSEFCANCGHRLGDYEFVPIRNTPLTGKDYLIMAAAFIPGALNVFGLGHLMLHKYSRGIMYLIISAVLLYIMYFTPDITTTTRMLLEVVGFVIYLKQSFEVMYGIYDRKDNRCPQKIGRKNTGRIH